MTHPSQLRFLRRNERVRNLFCAAMCALLLSGCQKGSAARPVQDDLGYAPQVALQDLHLSAELNFLGQQVTYLDGTAVNKGQKIVRAIKARLVFRDVMNQVVLRQDQTILPEGPVAMNPGQSREFHINFDQIPDSWNQAVPEVQIVSLRTQ